MTVQEYRNTMYGVAEAIAPGWERQRGFVEVSAAPVRDWMIRQLSPRPGQTLLELAAGAGDTGFEAAARLGESGRLISTDFAPSMLSVARRRGEELGIENVEYMILDAEAIALGTDSVDGVLCRFAYMLMSDPAAALGETRRVLRPGGRLTLAVWGPPERSPFFGLLGMTLVQRGHLPPPDPAVPGIFALSREERLRGLLDGAGFEHVRIEEIPVSFAVEDVEEYLHITMDTAGPIAILLRELPGGELKQIEETLERAFEPFADGDGYTLPAVAIAAAAS